MTKSVPLDRKLPQDKLKVLHSITVNGLGGAENLLLFLLPSLAQMGLKVNALLFYRSDHLKDAHKIGEQLSSAGIETFYREYKGIININNFRFLTRFLNEHKFDLIHSHLKHSDLWFAILKWRKKITIPVITTLHGYRDGYHNRNGLVWNKRTIYTLYYRVTKFICKQLDGFILISQGLANLFISARLLKSNKIRIIHHGTRNDDALIKSTNELKYEIVVCGRFVKFKGHEFAIQAVKRVRERFPDATLHFYGSGPEEANLKRIVSLFNLEKVVFFHGFVNEIIETINKHDIALIPSIGEPFGLVFFDAFKAGLPVVAFDLPASNEIITNSYNGLLARAYDVSDLSEQISRLLSDCNLRQQLTSNAVLRLNEEFSLDSMRNNYFDFYQFCWANCP